MDNQNLINCYNFIQEHKEVQEELKQEMQALKGADEATVFAKLVEFGKKHGFEFTVEDLKALNSQLNEDLSDEELEKVNGGTDILALTVGLVSIVFSTIPITIYVQNQKS